MKKLFIFVLMALLLLNAVSAFDISGVELNNLEITDATSNYVRSIVRDNQVDITVEVKSPVSTDNVQIEAGLVGLEHDADEAYAISDLFDMDADVTYVRDLKINLTKRIQNDKSYRLRIRVTDQDSVALYKDYLIYVNSDLHTTEIKDVLISPENEIRSGHSLLVEPLVKNYGERTERDVKVSVQLPELGLSGSTFIDEIDADKSVLSEPVFLRIPDCINEGTYTLLVKVSYNDGDDYTISRRKITVVNSDSCNNIATDNTPKTNFVAKYEPTSYPKVEEETSDYLLSKIILIGTALVIIFLVIFFIVRQARNEAMDDEEFLKELENEK